MTPANHSVEGVERDAPLVSVVTTAHEAGPFIGGVLSSIRAQTYARLEIVVVDDGSTDDTAGLVRAAAAEDPRIRAISPGRVGRGRALNLGIEQARGELIAINDADDPSDPERLALQVAFLRTHPAHGIVGTQCRTFDPVTGEPTTTNLALTDAEIRLELTRGPGLQHTSVMYRRNAILRIGGYDESRSFMFDREMFIRFAASSKVANLPDVLMTIGHHPQRFFYHRFAGRRREVEHNLLRFRALHRLGFPAWMYGAPLVGLATALLPGAVRGAIPRGLRSRLGRLIHPERPARDTTRSA